MRVSGEAGLGGDTIFVQYAEGTEGLELRRIIGGEGEGVISV